MAVAVRRRGRARWSHLGGPRRATRRAAAERGSRRSRRGAPGAGELGRAAGGLRLRWAPAAGGRGGARQPSSRLCRFRLVRRGCGGQKGRGAVWGEGGGFVG